MSERHDSIKRRKKFLLYPVEDDDQVKRKVDEYKQNVWDMILTLVLIFTCMVTPYRVAFIEEETQTWNVINIIIDSMFFIDIILIFNSAYYENEFELVDDRKKIAKNYLKSWFMFDLLAVIPFEFIVR